MLNTLRDFAWRAPVLARAEADVRRRRLLMYFHAGDPWLAEWIFALLKATWGAWLLMPTNTFAVAPHLYRYIAALHPPGVSAEIVWGALWLILGLSQWTAWYYNNRRWRWEVSRVGAFLWPLYGTLLWAGDHRTAALAFFVPLACACALTAYLLSPRVIWHDSTSFTNAALTPASATPIDNKEAQNVHEG